MAKKKQNEILECEKGPEVTISAYQKGHTDTKAQLSKRSRL